MSFSEKPDDEYSQKQSEQESNKDLTNIEENQRDSINSSNNNKIKKKSYITILQIFILLYENWNKSSWFFEIT